MKNNSLLYSFIVIVLTLTIGSYIIKDKTFSDLENRNLKTSVEFTIHSFLDGSFQKNYESYINDQFPLRNQWISLKSMGEYLLKKIENNGIIYGDNEYLFEKFYSIKEEKLTNNINAINLFSEKNKDKVSFMIVPNSYEIYKENLPLGAPQINQDKIIKKIYSLLNNSNNIDIMKSLIENKDKYIYYRTDHHWTILGAYLAYYEFIKSIGEEPIDLSILQGTDLDGFYGTYFSKAKPFNIASDILTFYEFDNINMDISGHIYESLYDYSKIKLRDKYALFLRGNNPLTIIKNNNLNNGKRLLVIKDSFANSVIPFLTQNYEEIHVVDLRTFTTRISTYLNENNFDNIFILYNFINLSTDNNIIKLKY